LCVIHFQNVEGFSVDIYMDFGARPILITDYIVSLNDDNLYQNEGYLSISLQNKVSWGAEDHSKKTASLSKGDECCRFEIMV